MSYRIPRTLDNPIRCLGVPVDIVVVFITVMGVFTSFEYGLIGSLVGVVVSNIYSKIKSRSVARKIIRIIYWYLPAEMNFICGVQGHIRSLTLSNHNLIDDINLKNDDSSVAQDNSKSVSLSRSVNDQSIPKSNNLSAQE